MGKKIITQAERSTLFNQWLNQQSMPQFKNDVERQKWWAVKCVEHDRIINQEYDILPNFYVENENIIKD